MAGEVPAYGWEEKVGFGFENPLAVYGTGVTPTWWLRPTSWNVNKDHTPVALPGAPGVPVEIDRMTAADVPRATLNAAKVAGSCAFELEYETIVPLMISLMASHDHAGPPGAFVGYAHTASTGPGGAVVGMGKNVITLPTNAAKMPPPMTMVRYTGQQDRTAKGMFIRSAEIKVVADGSATLTLEWMGQALTPGAGAGTPAYTYSETIRLQHLTLKYSATVGDAAPASQTNIHELTIRMERPLREIEASGAAGIRYPILEDFWNITLDFTTDWDSNTWSGIKNAATLAGRFGCLEVHLDSDDDVPGIAGSEPYHQIWRFPSCMCTTPGDPDHGGGGGALQENISFKVTNFDNAGTNEIASLTVYNAQNTAIAPFTP